MRFYKQINKIIYKLFFVRNCERDFNKRLNYIKLILKKNEVTYL